MKRRIWHRAHDRAWSETGKFLARPATIPGSAAADSSSISASMPWAAICAAYADGETSSSDFRRTTDVRDIVETVGAVEGRFYTRRIREWGSQWLSNEGVARVDAWGNPIRWPGFLLGTPRSFSPTTLRYLATALWLRKNGHVTEGSRITEIGVGFGGLAAMNALVSGAFTTLVDLPQVERAALRMLEENGLAAHAVTSSGQNYTSSSLVISNYAFTELNASIQQGYMEKYLKRTPHGVIVSNSSVFASSIRGRSDEELVAWLRSEGLPATLETANEILGPGDHLCGVTLIHW